MISRNDLIAVLDAVIIDDTVIVETADGIVSLIETSEGFRIQDGPDNAIEALAEKFPAFAELLLQGLEIKKQTARDDTNGPSTCERDNGYPTISTDRTNINTWKMVLYDQAKQACDRLVKSDPTIRDFLAATDVDTYVATINKLRNQDGLTSDPALSATELEEEVHAIALALQQNYLPISVNGDAAMLPARSILVENAEQALVSNAEYLSHPALIDRLYYTHHISLGVGGKHEGKTSAARTEALALALGLPVYGREVMRTPVIYAASDDEYPSTRMELLRMGWNSAVPLHLVRVAPDAKPDYVLEDLAKMARAHGAYFIVLDMLFDFAPIKDEMGYAHTRQAIGKIQQLADAIDGHAKATHHSPKHMPDAATAAKAALGSQGIAARFSPISLSRMWFPMGEGKKGLYTIESTMTRDPRGLALPQLCVELDERGWVQSKGVLEGWMKWPIYAERIVEYFQMQEPGYRCSVATVSRELEIPRPHVQNAMMRLTKDPGAKLERMTKLMGRGGGFTYALVGGNSLATVSESLSSDLVHFPIGNSTSSENEELKTQIPVQGHPVTPSDSTHLKDKVSKSVTPEQQQLAQMRKEYHKKNWDE